MYFYVHLALPVCLSVCLSHLGLNSRMEGYEVCMVHGKYDSWYHFEVKGQGQGHETLQSSVIECTITVGHVHCEPKKKHQNVF